MAVHATADGTHKAVATISNRIESISQTEDSTRSSSVSHRFGWWFSDSFQRQSHSGEEEGDAPDEIVYSDDDDSDDESDEDALAQPEGTLLANMAGFELFSTTITTTLATSLSFRSVGAAAETAVFAHRWALKFRIRKREKAKQAPSKESYQAAAEPLAMV